MARTWKKPSIPVLIIIFCGVVIGLIASPFIYRSRDEPPVSAVKDGGEESAPPLTDEYLWELAGRYYGQSDLVRSVTLSGEGMERSVEIGLDRPTSCGDGSVEGVMSAFVQKTVQSLFEYPEISKVEITMYGLDQGVKSNDVAVKASVNRAAAEAIDWYMFGPMTMPDMVSEYFVDQKINKMPGS